MKRVSTAPVPVPGKNLEGQAGALVGADPEFGSGFGLASNRMKANTSTASVRHDSCCCCCCCCYC